MIYETMSLWSHLELAISEDSCAVINQILINLFLPEAQTQFLNCWM